MIVWALFDSGNGCYSQVAKKFDTIELYAIGMDKENKNNHFINLNLAQYSINKKQNPIFDELDKLPKPDLIIASPPCESWSNASAMWGGNSCWKKEDLNSLFEAQLPLSEFTIRDYLDYEQSQYIPENQLITRINGELCIYNTIQIIKKYRPKFYVIENPAYGRIWNYINDILGFIIPYKNLTYYSAYGFDIQKPTMFKSNVCLNLKQDKLPSKIDFKSCSGYNKRSNIPLNLIEDIFNEILAINKKIKEITND